MALTDNLIAAYNFDGDVNDSFASNNGANTNITFSSGVVGQQGIFNGSAYATMPSGFGTALGSAFTIAFFIKSSRGSGNEGLLRNGKSYGAGFNGWDIYRNATLNHINFRSAYLTTVDNTTTNVVNANTRYHYAITYDGTTIRKYINGTLDSSSANTGSISGTGDANRLIGGALWNDAANNLLGEMDILLMYTRTLSDSEISQLYNSGNGNQYPFAGAFIPKITFL